MHAIIRGLHGTSLEVESGSEKAVGRRISGRNIGLCGVPLAFQPIASFVMGQNNTRGSVSRCC
jgi:hypothetical protein